MKPYQVKLRIIGVLSLILAVLVASIPLPSRAASMSAEDQALLNRFVFLEDEINQVFLISKYKNDGAETDLILPAEIHGVKGANTFRVRFASEGVFENCDTLVSAKIDEAVFSDIRVLRNMFKGCSALTSVTIDNNDATPANDIISVQGMFEGCSALTTIDIAALDTTDVTDMSSMFAGCTGLTELDLSTFTPSVTNVREMFAGCTALKKLNISGMNFAGVTTDNAAGMLKDCKALEEIQSPLNVPDESTASPATAPTEITLPHNFKYTPTDGSGTSGTETLTQKLPNGTISSVSQSLTLSKVIEEITITTETGAMSPDDPEQTLTLTVIPAHADPQILQLTNAGPEYIEIVADGTKVVPSADRTTARVTAENGTASVKLRFLKGDGFDAGGNPVSKTVSFKADPDPSVVTPLVNVIPATADIVATDKKIPVTQVTIGDFTDPVMIPTKQTFTAAVEPATATTKTVKWSVSGNGDVATIDADTGELTPHYPGTVTVTAESVEGGHKDFAVVTVETPYTFTVKDLRTDGTNNLDKTTGSCTGIPVEKNWVMQIDSTTLLPTEETLLNTTGSYDSDRFYFTLTKKDDGTGDLSATDFGDVTITMALHGRLAGTAAGGRMPMIMALDTRNGWEKIDHVERASVYDSTGAAMADALTFTVDSAALAPKYAIVVGEAAAPVTHKLAARDHRSDQTGNTTVWVTPGSNTTLNSDLYLQIKDKDTGTVLPRHIEADTVLKTYTGVRKYYDIYVSTDADGNNPVTADRSFTIKMSLPTAVDLANGTARFVRQNEGGTAIDAAFSYALMTGSDGKHYVEFTADHFSEHALLYNTNDDTTISVTVDNTNVTGGNGGATPNSDGSWTLRAVPAEGYVFTGWRRPDGTLRNENPYTYTPTVSETLTPTFAPTNSGGGNTGTSGGSDTGGTNSGSTSGATSSGSNSGDTSGGGSGSGTGGTTPVIIGARGPGNVTQVPSTNGPVLVASADGGARFVEWQDSSGASLGTDLSLALPQGATSVLAVFEPMAAGNTASSGTSSGDSGTSGSSSSGTSGTDSSATTATSSSSATTSDSTSGTGASGSGSTGGTSGTSSSGTGSTSNANNMPRTGSADMYRVIFVLLLVFSGTVEVLLSIPKKRRLNPQQ